MVVETIDFYEDEEAELPAPLTLADVKALNKAAPFGEEEAAAEDGADEDGKPREVRCFCRTCKKLWQSRCLSIYTVHPAMQSEMAK